MDRLDNIPNIEHFWPGMSQTPSSIADVCFYEAFEEETEALRRCLGPDVRAVFTDRTIQETGHTEPPARIVSTRTQSVFPDPWADRIAILTRSTGYDHVTAYRQRTGMDVPAGYLPLYCHRAVAEQAMLLWTALLRRLPDQIRQFRTFHRNGLTGRENQGRRLLVVGVGHIGSRIAQIGLALGMEVRGVDIDPRHSFVQYVSIEEGLPWADVIVCAMSLTAANRGYFTHQRFKKVRPGLVFVNVARGELSPSTVLLREVRDGRLAGVALDVYDRESELAVALRTGRASDDEQVAATLALAGEPNVILTPHNAFNTHEAVERKAGQSVEQIREFLGKGAFLWPVP